MGERGVVKGLGGIGRLMDRLESGFIVPRGRGRLVRPRYPRVIAGVCAGVAEYFGWDVRMLRVLLLVLAVFSLGLLVLGYGLAWVVIPEGVRALPGTTAS